jgi:Ca2+ transporting ATPase
MAEPELKEVFANDLPSTLAMSVLVVVEMFSACTAVSERQSLVVMPPWKNFYLLLAVVASLFVHIVTLEVKFTQKVFSVVHLNTKHWILVLVLGFPTVLIEELFKFYLRHTTKKVTE